MRNASALACLLLLALPAAPAWAAPIDAKTVKLFLAACAKDQNSCNDEISGQILAESDGDLQGQICLTDDMHDAPIMISRAMLTWLKSAKQVAAETPAQAISAGAKILYPCNP